MLQIPPQGLAGIEVIGGDPLRSSPRPVRLCLMAACLAIPTRRQLFATGATVLGLSLALCAVPAQAQEVQQRESFSQFVPGMLARVRYEAPATGPFQVQIWDLLVGPGLRSDPALLPGAGVLEVRSGSGVLTFDSQEVPLQPGTVVSVPEGARLSLENGDEVQGLAIRAVVIVGRTP